MIFGGFPDALKRTPPQRSRYLRSYVQATLARDLPDVVDVRVDPFKLEQLLPWAVPISGLWT